jgi:hypothetical protein
LLAQQGVFQDETALAVGEIGDGADQGCLRAGFGLRPQFSKKKLAKGLESALEKIGNKHWQPFNILLAGTRILPPRFPRRKSLG